MNSKKIYIGIATILVIILISVVSIFYISSKNKDVKKLSENVVNENAKEAMESTEDEKSELNDANEEEEKIQEMEQQEEESKEEPKQEEKKEEVKVEEPKKEIVVTPLEKTMYVTASSLNVRTGPDTSYNNIGSLPYSSEVNITGKTDEWFRISYNNRVAFVKGSYLSDNKPEPKPEPTPTISNEVNESYGEGSSVSHLIIINSKNNTLRYYRDGSLFKGYACATGAGGTPTPQGKFAIFEKLVNRPYYKLNIPGGAPNNPLGPRWMQFKSGGYAIHGTNVDSSIGGNVSHGCVRMHNYEVIELYNLVPIGTTVIVKSTSQSDKDIAAGYGISIN